MTMMIELLTSLTGLAKYNTLQGQSHYAATTALRSHHTTTTAALCEKSERQNFLSTATTPSLSENKTLQ